MGSFAWLPLRMYTIYDASKTPFPRKKARKPENPHGRGRVVGSRQEQIRSCSLELLNLKSRRFNTLTTAVLPCGPKQRALGCTITRRLPLSQPELCVFAANFPLSLGVFGLCSGRQLRSILPSAFNTRLFYTPFVLRGAFNRTKTSICQHRHNPEQDQKNSKRREDGFGPLSRPHSVLAPCSLPVASCSPSACSSSHAPPPAELPTLISLTTTSKHPLIFPRPLAS